MKSSDGAGSAPEDCGLTVTVIVRVAPPPVAEIVTAVELVTGLEVTENCAVVEPDTFACYGCRNRRDCRVGAREVDACDRST